MVRTIEVIFIPCGNRQPISNKSYFFLCTYDEVNVGDIIIDSRYITPMKVVSISNCTSSIQNGHILKDINIDTLNGRKANKPNNTRTFSITIEQARDWCESDNETLRILANSMYTPEELESSYQFIEDKVQGLRSNLYIPIEDEAKFSTMAKLATIAKYYNGAWKRTTDNTGYFIGSCNTHNIPFTGVTKGIGVYKQCAVVSAGIIYFRTEEDAIKAAKILGDEVKNLL